MLIHLDSLLAIAELDAIQWVYTAGTSRASDHIKLYQKIQKSGKGIQISEVFPDEIDFFTEHLNPEGIWMKVKARNLDEADYALKKISSWKRAGSRP